MKQLMATGAAVLGWLGLVRWTEMWNTLPHEPAMPMPGDELVLTPALDATRAIVVGGRPHDVYRWLAQMGPGRAGWYSYDRIDNRGVESAREIHPDWVVDESGASLGRIAGIELVAADPAPGRHLVLSLPAGSSIALTVSYLLVPWGEDATRVVARVRADAARRWLRPVLRYVLGPADFVMMRRQLAGLRDRVEASGATRLEARGP